MFRSILGTLGSKFGIAFINFLIIVITTQILGKEGRGEISLLTLNITILVMCSNFMGGPNLVYLVPRFSLQKLLLPSYAWAIISCGIGWGILEALQLNLHFGFHVLALALLECLGNTNCMAIWGKNNIKAFNVINLVRFALIASVFSYLLFFQKSESVYSYVIALYVANGVYLIVSQVKVYSYIESFLLTGVYQTVKATFKFGAYSQMGGFAQLLNYRLSFLILEHSWSTAIVGVYSTGVAMAEAFWLISRSISQVQYSAISNSDDKKYSLSITVFLLKINVLATTAVLVPALLVPDLLYIKIFGSGFGEVKNVLFLLFPGILAISFSGSISHYLAGMGKHHINAITAVIGLCATVLFGLLLIPIYGIAGAAITANLSYIAMAIYNFTILLKQGAKFKDFLFTKNDSKLFFGSILKFFGSDK